MRRAPLQAKTRLDYALCAPLEQTVIQGQADILFLNPPYDEVGGERIELRFLRLALPSLREGGLAIFVLPEHYVGEGKQVKPFAALLRKYGCDHLKVCASPTPATRPSAVRDPGPSRASPATGKRSTARTT